MSPESLPCHYAIQLILLEMLLGICWVIRPKSHIALQVRKQYVVHQLLMKIMAHCLISRKRKVQIKNWLKKNVVC